QHRCSFLPLVTPPAAPRATLSFPTRRSSDLAGSSYGNRIDGVLTCPPWCRVSSPRAARYATLRGRLAAHCHPPHLVREPLEPLLRVFQLLGRHLLGAPRDIPRVLARFVQCLAQRPVGAALD